MFFSLFGKEKNKCTDNESKLKESLFNKSKKQWNIWRGLQVSGWYYQNKKNKKGKSGVQGIHAFKQFIVKTINVHITK